MTKQRLAGLIGLVLLAAVGVWWAERETPDDPTTVEQLQKRIAALEKRLAELESARPAAVQFAPQTVELLPQTTEPGSDPRGERREINGMSYYLLPLGDVAGVE